jgi:hypothetical protein
MMEEEESLFKPKRPITIRTVFVSVLAQRPENVKDTKSMSKPFYEFLSSCTENDSNTLTCPTAEWESEEKPFEISK